MGSSIGKVDSGVLSVVVSVAFWFVLVEDTAGHAVSVDCGNVVSVEQPSVQ